VNPESGNTEADGDPVVSADQTNPSARLAELERRFSEVLLALRRESEPPPPDEGQGQVDASGEDITPEVKTAWEDTVRRFTGSIDVRLDILEDELGGLQDELRRLQQVAQEKAEVAQGRVLRRFAIGQVVLGVLVVALFLALRFGWGEDSRAEAPQAASADPPVPAGRIVPEPGPASLPVSPGPGGSPALETAPEPSQPPSPAQDSVSLDGEGEDGARPGSGAPSRPAPEVTTPQAPETEPASPGDQMPPREQAPDARATSEQTPASGVPEQASEAGPVASAPEIDGQDSTVSADEPSAAAGAARQEQPKDAPRIEAMDPNASAVAAEEETSAPDAGPDVVVLENERFAIQLISFRSESSVRPFAERYGIVDDARYMLSDSAGQTWYSVFLGNFATREEGRAAVEALSPELVELKPWVRSLSPGTSLVPVSASGESQP
jgi:septal ring-binding cell division protein DamX